MVKDWVSEIKFFSIAVFSAFCGPMHSIVGLSVRPRPLLIFGTSHFRLGDSWRCWIREKAMDLKFEKQTVLTSL